MSQTPDQELARLMRTGSVLPVAELNARLRLARSAASASAARARKAAKRASKNSSASRASPSPSADSRPRRAWALSRSHGRDLSCAQRPADSFTRRRDPSAYRCRGRWAAEPAGFRRPDRPDSPAAGRRRRATHTSRNPADPAGAECNRWQPCCRTSQVSGLTAELATRPRPARRRRPALGHRGRRHAPDRRAAVRCLGPGLKLAR